MLYDITILTDRRYVDPDIQNDYIRNVLLEDQLVRASLEKRGLKVHRTNWDDKHFDWGKTRYALFRTTWDYFDRFQAFNEWLGWVRNKTKLINPYSLIQWNIDKSYLFELRKKGIPIPPSTFIPAGITKNLMDIVQEHSWDRFILKPAIAGAARHTYLFDKKDVNNYESIFKTLIKVENMILQEYQEQITSKGEITLMMFGSQYSHAVIKKAKAGDFRVQDDFGGSVAPYRASPDSKALALKAIEACPVLPAYGRVDMMWDNHDELCISELELIEPELWFRLHPEAADQMASSIIDYMKHSKDE
jgi:glutathione synthase/RimK-type ligase-like ATP-grasp enzyme